MMLNTSLKIFESCMGVGISKELPGYRELILGAFLAFIAGVEDTV